jgi:hypothetical protein
LLRARRFRYFHTSQPRSAYRRFHTTPVFREPDGATDHAEASSAGFVVFGAMWMYLAVGFGVLIAFKVLVVAVIAVAARHIEPREELRPAQRARLITYVRSPSETQVPAT